MLYAVFITVRKYVRDATELESLSILNLTSLFTLSTTPVGDQTPTITACRALLGRRRRTGCGATATCHSYCSETLAHIVCVTVSLWYLRLSTVGDNAFALFWFWC
jgi:hypothetical protein